MVRGIKKKRTFRFHYRDAGLLVIGQRSSVPDPIVQLQVRSRLLEAETESGQVSLYTEEASFL